MAAAIGASSSTFGFATEQLRVQQARRNADRAEAAANALQRQAAGAQRQADAAQENARSLKVRSDEAQGDAGQARQQVSSLQSVQGLQQQFSTLRTQISEGLAALDTQSTSINADGQTTGTLVNEVA
jgi:chromosome segregation ATPase